MTQLLRRHSSPRTVTQFQLVVSRTTPMAFADHLAPIQLPILRAFSVLRIPEDVVGDVAKRRSAKPPGLLSGDLTSEVRRPEDLVEQVPNEMDVLVPNLNENGSRVGQKFPRD